MIGIISLVFCMLILASVRVSMAAPFVISGLPWPSARRNRPPGQGHPPNATMEIRTMERAVISRAIKNNNGHRYAILSIAIIIACVDISCHESGQDKPKCGDGKIAAWESCDDMNNNNIDGCFNNCRTDIELLEYSLCVGECPEDRLNRYLSSSIEIPSIVEVAWLPDSDGIVISSPACNSIRVDNDEYLWFLFCDASIDEGQVYSDLLQIDLKSMITEFVFKKDVDGNMDFIFNSCFGNRCNIGIPSWYNNVTGEILVKRINASTRIQLVSATVSDVAVS